jgi:hypothetical protein
LSELLTAAAILAVNDLKIEKVETPEWGGHVFVRSMTGTERDAWESENIKKNKQDKYDLNLANIRARLCQMTICDEKGTLLFNGSQIAELGKKNAAAMDRCFSVGQRLSGISKQDLEDMTKNSETDRSADSSSN